MDNVLLMYEGLNAKDSAHISAFDTKIDIRDLETGEIIFKGLKNKVILPGSGFIARHLFDIDKEEVTPTYNSVLKLDEVTTERDATVEWTKADKDNHKILLFCVGIGGCGTENSQVFPVDYKMWIKPEEIVPFRYQLSEADLTEELREMYFGRATVHNEDYGSDFIAYYFKRFEGQPRLVQQFVDGTPIDENVYTSDKNTSVETYVEVVLKITKEDCRDFFSMTTGINNARINTISLCSAYPVTNNDGHTAFKDIRPVTKLNIPNEPLIDLTKGIEIIYQVYM